VGEKGQVVIPKELREKTGIKEGTEVSIEAKGGAVVITRRGPLAESYVEYFSSTLAKKLDRPVDIKKLLGEETLELNRTSHSRP